MQVESVYKNYQLDHRISFVVVPKESNSLRPVTPSGAKCPLGSLRELGPCPFLVLINDLDVDN